MEYTETQKAQFMESYAARRARQIAISIALIILMLPLAIVGDRVPALSIIMVALVIVAVAFSLRNWRCPACNGYLGKGFGQKFCQRCGVQLRA